MAPIHLSGTKMVPLIEGESTQETKDMVREVKKKWKRKNLKRRREELEDIDQLEEDNRKKTKIKDVVAVRDKEATDKEEENKNLSLKRNMVEG